MKRFIAIFAFAFVWPALAQAQMVTKAPPVVTPGYSGGNGFFFGLGAEGSGTSIANAPAPGTTAIGGDLEAVIGYGFTAGHIPMFIDASIGFQNLNASSSGFALSGPAHAVLPPGVTVNGATQSYWFAGAMEDDVSATAGVATAHEWLVSAVTGPGLLIPVKVSNWNSVIDVWAGLTLTSSGLCVGSAPATACPQLGTGARAGVRFLF